MQQTATMPRFARLPAINTMPPTLRPGTQLSNFRLPKVVNQILTDCEEHWYHLARSLEDRVMHSDLKTVMVISSLHGEGCTTISLCLATAVSKVCKRRILVLDADFSHPGLRDALSLRPKIGLERVVLEGLPVELAVIKAESPSFAVVPMLNGFQYPSMLQKNAGMADLMETLRQHYDLIIVDGGSAFAGRNPMPLTVGIDAALIIRDPNKSGERLLEQLDLFLSEKEISGLGVIENCVE